MTLTDRMQALRGGGGGGDVRPAHEAVPAAAAAPSQPVAAAPVVAVTRTSEASGNEALTRLKDRAVSALFDRMGARLNDPTLSENQLHALVRTELNHVVEQEKVPLSGEQRQRLIADVEDDVLGHGPLQRLLDDPTITEIMVNGPDLVFVEQNGKLTLSSARFTSEDQLRRVIERIVSRVGRRIDESSPLVDARLSDGSRVNAVIAPIAFSGSSLTIRKFAKDPFKVHDLISFGTLSPEMAELLRACVEARLNIIVSGGTGTGKTTLLNVLSSFIPEGERIVTIEDAVELQLQQTHVVRLESRPPNVEGRGEIGIRDLVRNSLRMRPDRIVVGEVRGGESLDMLQAMNTGHDGSLSTVHANSPRDAVARLETLVLMAGMDLPLRAIREQIASAVDVVVQLTRLRDGTRRVTAVTEIQGMEGQTVTMQDAFLFDYSAGVDAHGRFLGKPVSTGIRPRFTDKFADHGITLSPRVFATPRTGPGPR
ncbi:pilus assembly protein CpaF [Friedmanniella luteola]|uniref:Pilus assembly protein CpaF n=1 Tax=Friedmanniella luteola TaxID=546871 RepID=A0A1H1X923_9ACTN|nr:CpaF family protein [Friedmanniella luteola]SDT05815.1 pilus assembly protein CpaF [Friedmanniella luteola]